MIAGRFGREKPALNPLPTNTELRKPLGANEQNRVLRVHLPKANPNRAVKRDERNKGAL
jgi:hypothetical protein